MKQYQTLLKKIITENDVLLLDTKNISSFKERPDRTGTGTISIFGEQLVFDLRTGFPLLTTKRVHFKSVIHELLWFLSGDSNIHYLNENGVTIWDEWADSDGNLGPVYGVQWRNWNNEGIDQISILIDNIKNNPYSRRHIVSTWNTSVLPNEKYTFSENIKNNKMALAPCHILFQLYVTRNGYLDCHVYQRSVDYFLGAPFNIASYSLLLTMIAQQTNYIPGRLIYSLGDIHLYKNHFEQALILLDRTPKELPTLVLSKKPSIFDYTINDFSLSNYDPYPAIKADISI